MAKTKKVLKIERKTILGVHTTYVQQVTEKVICCINNELCTTQYYRDGGAPRPRPQFNTTYIAVSQVEAFLKENNIKTWNGGWLPSRNSRGEKVREVPCLGDFKSYDEWFNAQGVEIIDLTK